MNRCGRTEAIVDTLLDGAALSRDQVEHATTCADCARRVAQARRFEEELHRVGDALTPEPLAPILATSHAMTGGTGHAVLGRQSWWAGLGVAVAVLVTIVWAGTAVEATRLPAGGHPQDAAPDLSPYVAIATEHQLAYFDDGLIEYEEYETAVLATVACVRAAGHDVGAEMASDGMFQYVGGVGTEPNESGNLGDAIDACRGEWSMAVELAYAETIGPSPDELPAVRTVIDCLRRAGRPPTDGVRVDQLRAFIAELGPRDLASACAALLPGQ